MFNDRVFDQWSYLNSNGIWPKLAGEFSRSTSIGANFRDSGRVVHLGFDIGKTK